MTTTIPAILDAPDTNLRHAASLLRAAANMLDPVDATTGDPLPHDPALITATAWRVADAGLLLRSALDRMLEANKTASVVGYNVPTGRGAMLTAHAFPHNTYDVFVGDVCVAAQVRAESEGKAALTWALQNRDYPNAHMVFALPTDSVLAHADVDPADALVFAAVAHDDDLLAPVYDLLLAHLDGLIEDGALAPREAVAHASVCAQALCREIRNRMNSEARTWLAAGPLWGNE
jgi:hypothetical protein